MSTIDHQRLEVYRTTIDFVASGHAMLREIISMLVAVIRTCEGGGRGRGKGKGKGKGKG